MKRVFILIGRIFGLVISNQVIEKLSFARTFLFTGVLSRSFNKFGHDSTVDRPLQLVKPRCVSVGNNTHILKGARITALSNKSNICIGSNVEIGYNCHITCLEKIIIGDGCLMGANILISDNSHGQLIEEQLSYPPSKRPLYSKGSIIIEENVWIGENVSILSGVTIGKGAIIGANSVVTHDVQPFSLAVGAPAKVIKTQNKD